MLSGEVPYWLAFNKAPGIGPKRFYKLVEVFGDARTAWEADVKELAGVIGKKIATDLVSFRRNLSLEEEVEQVEKVGCKLLLATDHNYPPLLKKIIDPPPVLYYKGEFRPEDQMTVAVIGSRRATPSGLATAMELAADLAVQGITVVSGLARGIDSAAHRGALAVKGGRTIAVLGCGIDRIYPPENKELMEKITFNGVVCSEFPLGTRPFPGNFPARNRVISGLSLGVTVVEAAEDSGSLITVEFALEQGREVFAIPGPIDRQGSKGPHRLIKQGAKLVEEVNDILETLNLPFLSADELITGNEKTIEFSPVEQCIWDLLAAGETHVDILIRDSGRPVSEVSSALVLMELKGLISQVAAKTFHRKH
ncbi:MAG TPA: DNA-protecting protein DprA [Firmicutes bacterium]|nr:DNA-protecting protein DprA [Bacillota bacterium]HBT16810.1 DNA-protecting protein DprA [Bacillota bacterium]